MLLNLYDFAHRELLFLGSHPNHNHPISGMTAFSAAHARAFSPANPLLSLISSSRTGSSWMCRARYCSLVLFSISSAPKGINDVIFERYDSPSPQPVTHSPAPSPSPTHASNPTFVSGIPKEKRIRYFSTNSEARFRSLLISIPYPEIWTTSPDGELQHFYFHGAYGRPVMTVAVWDCKQAGIPPLEMEGELSVTEAKQFLPRNGFVVDIKRLSIGSTTGQMIEFDSRVSGYKSHSINWLDSNDGKVLESDSVSNSCRDTFSNG
jgi:hypothetical protein